MPDRERRRRKPFRGALRKSFLERNQRVIGTIGLLVLLGGSAIALLMSSGVFARTYHVTAYFSDAAGIQPGDHVTVAGLNAGSVKAVRIDGGRVAMDLAVNKGVSLPRDSSAQVVIETLLGRESVRLVAGQAAAPLADGSVIPIERTTTPIDITKLNDISVNLLQRSDAGALNTLLKEVSAITAGKGAQVSQIASGLANVLQAVDARRTQLASLIDALRSISTTLGERDQTIVSLIDNLNPILADLAARQRDIQTLLVATDSASHQTADLVARNRSVLNQTLSALHTDLTVLGQHQLDLAATISYLNQAVEGYSSVGYSAGVPNHWANIFVQSLGPAGVDALIGPCGLVDQLIDQALGLNCTREPGSHSGGGGIGGGGGIAGGGGGGGGGGGLPIPTPTLPGGGGGGGGGGPLPTPTLPLPLPSPTLPLGPASGSGSGASGTGHAAAPSMPDGLRGFLDWVLTPQPAGGPR